MRFIRIHNYYQQAGGEDAVCASEIEMLRRYGHEVERFHAHNDAIEGMSTLTLAGKTIWNRQMSGELSRVFREFRPRVAHFDNTFPLISPAAYYAARDAGIPVVQTLHNFRLLCPSAILYRDGKVCEDCLPARLPWPGLVHACYRDNRKATAAIVAMTSIHRALGTYENVVDVYIALTEFSRRKFIEGGLPAHKIVVKPNFLETDPGIGSGAGDFALFVGRLTPEKGIETLLEAWQKMGRGKTLKIVGDGPLADRVKQAACKCSDIQYLGRRGLPEVLELMGEARFLVFPSVWYEGFPRTIVEAFARGTPVVASRLGSMAEIVEENVTGLHFESGNADELVSSASRLYDDSRSLNAMRSNARAVFEAQYTVDRNYQMLIEIYDRVMTR